MRHSNPQLRYSHLDEQSVNRIAEIDRSEEIFEQYKLVGGKLERVPFRVSVDDFDPNELNEMIIRQQKIIQNGGTVIGAFDWKKLAGVASVENVRLGAQKQFVKMDILYVDKQYRKAGVGNKLLTLCQERALLFGADKLYISATPTCDTVDFYMKRGAALTNEIIPMLFELEPLDIHLQLALEK